MVDSGVGTGVWFAEWLSWRRETAFDSARVATDVATPVDVYGRSNTIQHDDLGGSNTQ